MAKYLHTFLIISLGSISKHWISGQSIFQKVSTSRGRKGYSLSNLANSDYFKDFLLFQIIDEKYSFTVVLKIIYLNISEHENFCLGLLGHLPFLVNC